MDKRLHDNDVVLKWTYDVNNKRSMEFANKYRIRSLPTFMNMETMEQIIGVTSIKELEDLNG